MHPPLIKITIYCMVSLYTITGQAASSLTSAVVPSVPRAVPPSPYILECRDLLLSKHIPSAVVSLILAYKNTTDAHAKAVEWIREEQALWGQTPTGFAQEGSTQYSTTPGHFPIAGFFDCRSDAHSELLFDRRAMQPALFALRFFNIHSEAWISMFISTDANRICTQYWIYDKKTGRIHLKTNLPLGTPSSTQERNGRFMSSSSQYNGLVNIVSPSKKPPHAKIPLEDGTTLHIVVVDHGYTMTDSTKNRCFDYWIEKESPQKSECIVQ